MEQQEQQDDRRISDVERIVAVLESKLDQLMGLLSDWRDCDQRLFQDHENRLRSLEQSSTEMRVMTNVKFVVGAGLTAIGTFIGAVLGPRP